MEASSTLDEFLPYQESGGVCSSLGREKVMARVFADVMLRSLGGDVDAVTILKSWFSPVSPICAQLSRSTLTLTAPILKDLV